jgi:hypothetical protein
MAVDDPHDMSKFPPAGLPVIFADVVASIAWSTTNVKFYLARNHPAVDASGGISQEVVAQVVMPIDTFASAALLFEATLKRMVAEGKLTNDMVDQLRAFGEARNA